MRPIDCIWFKAGVPHPVTRAHTLRLYAQDATFTRTNDGIEVRGHKGNVAWVPMSNVAALELGAEKQPELPSKAPKGGRA